MDTHRSFSSRRPSPQQHALSDATMPLFPPPSTQIPERIRSQSLHTNCSQERQPGSGYDVAHHAGSPQEMPIVCETMFDEKQLVTNNRAMFMSGGENPEASEKPVKRRMRGITSCLECRRRKMKCGRTQPCDHCHKSGRVCIYLGDRLDPDNQGKITEIKERVSSLELQLQKAVVHERIGGGLLGSDVPAYSIDPSENGLEISHMVTSDLIYENDDQDNDLDEDEDEDEVTNDMIDLGFKVGRMRMTERIGGLNRPRLAEEINVALASKPGSFGFDLSPVTKPRAASPRKSRSPGEEDTNSHYIPEDENMTGGDPNSSSPVPEFLRPSGDYIAPSSSALFGHLTAVPPVQKLLPSAWICNFLKNAYFANVHPIASCLHQPTFEQQFREFLILVGRGRQPRRPRQALVFAVLFSGVVAADASEIAARFNVRKVDLVALVKFGVEASLGKANLLRTTSVEAMQAFVIYLVALCRDEVSRSHSILVGAAIRMAECMALHRDGTAFGLTSLETHVRRLIWHQLCFLDIRTCEAQGPRPTIHREDYDTKLPYNCNDEDLTLEAKATPFLPKQSWATSFLVVLRFEINEMIRIIWFDRIKLELRKSHLTIVMAKIERFCQRLHEKYEGYLDDGTPIKRYTRLVKELYICRMRVMILHPYHSNTNNPLSERFHSALIQSGIRIIEIGIELETNPEFAQWRWYLGAFMQYQIALLLTTEAFHGQSVSEEDRISRCLDYVFDTKPSQSLHEKAQCILFEVMQKSATYCEFRKLRAPTATKQAVPQAVPAQSSSTASGSNATTPSALSLSGTSVSHREMTDMGMIKDEMTSPIVATIPKFPTGSSSSASSVRGASMQFPLPPPQYKQQTQSGGSQTYPLQHHQLQQHQQQQRQHQLHQQLRYQPATDNGRDEIPRGMVQSDAAGLLSVANQSLYAFIPQNQLASAPMTVGTISNGNNMVFSGVANGEALWGHPQVVNADSPEAFGGDWTGNAIINHQQQQQQQQQHHPQQHHYHQHQHQHQQQPQHIEPIPHQYPYTATPGQYQETGTNLLDGISWEDLNTMLPKNA